MVDRCRLLEKFKCKFKKLSPLLSPKADIKSGSDNVALRHHSYLSHIPIVCAHRVWLGAGIRDSSLASWAGKTYT